MKRNSLLLVLFLFIIQVALGSDAHKIMTAVDQRETGKTFLASYTMDIINKGKVKTRDLVWWRRDDSPKTFNLIKIRTPKKLKNTGLLIHSNKAGINQTWLFLSKAAKKEPRKISSNNKDSRFLGSDFYYVDFEETGVNEFNHKYLKVKKIKQWDSHVIESIPKKQDYTYSKIVSYVDKKSNVVIRTELYREGEKEKIFSVLSMNKIQNIWTIQSSLMENIKKKRKTKMNLNKIKYNHNLPKKYFSLENLTRDI